MRAHPPLTAWLLLRYLGPRWLLFRSWYAFKQRSGLLRRRSPASRWDAHPLTTFLLDPSLANPDLYLRYRCEHGPTFFFAPTQRPQFVPYFASWDQDGVTPITYAEHIQDGTLRYFEYTPVHVGFPPAWHRNPFTNEQLLPDGHWSQISDFGCGDIKVIWEASRFGVVYTLVRAYWRTGDERYAEAFWRLVEDWRLQNPPQLGPQWKCGQEISFRVMSWCFGLYGFLKSQSTTAERVTTLAQMIAVSGQRIEANIGYALSQRNNHGISEGMGLWTIGVLFPELCAAARWRNLGRHVLETQGRELIYNDGAFAQHSVNYHRLMLQDYLWSLRLGDLNHQPLSTALRERVGHAGRFLYHIQDADSGRVPYYGQNDGALILPLNNCDYHDFRPVVQATHYLTTGTRCYLAGSWDEDLLWLFGPEALTSPVISHERADFTAEVGGYHTLRSRHSFVFTRCAPFQHRPGHADLLHVDLWWRGHNIALDAGTFSYNAPQPWDNPLSHTAYHNTVTVDGQDQMTRVGKFLWLPWPHGRVHKYQRSHDGRLAYWEGEHDGYKRLKPAVRHRRGILCLNDDYWLVLDAVQSSKIHGYRLHWLLPDMPYKWDIDAGHLALQTPSGPYHLQLATCSATRSVSLVRADDHTPRGWHAPYYSHREPALSLALMVQADTMVFWTLFGPEVCRIQAEQTALSIQNDCWHAQVTLQSDAKKSLVASAAVTGAVESTLDLT